MGRFFIFLKQNPLFLKLSLVSGLVSLAISAYAVDANSVSFSEFIVNNMAPIMFGALVFFLITGFPVAFSLGAVGIVFGFLGIYLGLFESSFFQALPERVFGIMNNDTLLAIPFFCFMGLILERSGMAEDLLDTIGQLFGPLKGGLAYAVIFVGAMLAATTGIVAASVISMGLISLPIMLRYNYSRKLASGVIAASGTLAQILPPSIVLIIIADQLGRSVGDMYRGALLPSLLLVAFYLLYVLVLSLVSPKSAPPIPEPDRLKEEDGKSGLPSLIALFFTALLSAYIYRSNFLPEDAPTDEVIVLSILVGMLVAFIIALIDKVLKLGVLSEIARRVTFVMVPPLALIFLVLGTIFLGMATPTEGGAMGAVGALLMSFLRKRLSLSLLKQAMDTTAKLTTFVIFILIGARVFSLTFYGVDGHVWVEHLLVDLPGGQLGFLIFINILIFILAFFLDFFELAFIIIPLLAPVAEKLGIDLIWFGVLLAVNMQTSFMHPPFGFSLFYLRSVAPKEPYKDEKNGKTIQPVTTGQIYWGALPFLMIQIIMVAILIFFPKLVTGMEEKLVQNNEVDIYELINEEDSSVDDSPLQEDELVLQFDSGTTPFSSEPGKKE